MNEHQFRGIYFVSGIVAHFSPNLHHSGTVFASI